MVSSAKLILRSKLTKSNQYGIVPDVEKIPSDEVCVLYLGGNGTKTDEKSSGEQKANGNAKIIEQQVINDFPDNIPIYAVKYDFDEKDSGGDRDRHRFIFESNIPTIRSYHTKSKEVYLKKQNIKSQIKNLIPFFLIEDKLLSLPELEKKLNLLKIYVTDDYDNTIQEFSDELIKTLKKIGYNNNDAERIRTKILLNCAGNHIEYTQYIDELFKKTLLHRFSDNGKRLSLQDAMQRIRKLNIVTHCHGAYVAQKLADKAYNKMQELGYSQQEIKKILSQLLIVAHAPAYNPTKQDAHFLGFMSAFDNDAFSNTPYNWVREYIGHKRSQDQKLMMRNSEKNMHHEWLKNGPIFLGKNGGNLFLVAQGFEFGEYDGGYGAHPSEHSNTNYIKMPEQTDEGFVLNLIARNVLRNALKNSLNQDREFIPLPKNEDLIKGVDKESKLIRPFSEMERDGQDFMRRVYEIAKDNVKFFHKTKNTPPKTQNSER